MKHILYRTFDCNGKYYIGRHSTHNIDDGYMGSGKWIKDCHKGNVPLEREILMFCESFEELLRKEEQMIAKHIDNKLCMNFWASSMGGQKGKSWGKHKNRTWGRHTEEARKKISMASRGRPAWNKGKNWEPEKLKQRSDSIRGSKRSEETRAKMRLAQGGSNNPMFGQGHRLKWWNNGQVAVRRESCPGEGWVPGRKIKDTNGRDTEAFRS